MTVAIPRTGPGPRPDARPQHETLGLRRYWEEARLRAEDARSTSRRPAPGAAASWREALTAILEVGYGHHDLPRWSAGGWRRIERRTTPSAGALYPFETLVVLPGDGAHLWTIDPAPGTAPTPPRLVPLAAPAPPEEIVAAAGLAAAPDEPPVRALLVLAIRPWRSMAKYRRRGYAYCHLDAGHAALSLALYAAALGAEPTVHLRFDRAALAAGLGLDGLCREPLAALAWRAEASEAERSAALPPTTSDLVRLEPPSESEREAWSSLEGALSSGGCVALPELPARAPALEGPDIEAGPAGAPADAEHGSVPLPFGRPAPAAARERRAAILARRSAKGFRDEPLDLAALGELLAAVRDPSVATDAGIGLPARLGLLRARLLARRVDGAHGVFAYAPENHSLHPVDAVAGDPGPACMHQEVARQAAAILVLHAPVGRRLTRGGWSAFAELHFRAAEIAQRLYLAAARISPVGLTCIGGFDGAETARLVALPEGEEAVYVVLLGVRDDDAVKHDRLAVAYSHGATDGGEGA